MLLSIQVRAIEFQQRMTAHKDIDICEKIKKILSIAEMFNTQTATLRNCVKLKLGVTKYEFVFIGRVLMIS